MPLIALTCTERTIRDNLAIVDAHRSRIQAAELRIDHLSAEEKLYAYRFPALAGVPVIATIRRKTDGGAWEGTEEDRVRLFRKALTETAAPRIGSARPRDSFAIADFEDDADFREAENSFRQAGGRVIRSLYDFTGVPASLVARLSGARKHPEDIVKAAVFVAGAGDLSLLMAASRSLSGDRILIGMGEAGLPLGILSAKLGNFLTYCSPRGKETAPEHLSPDTLEEVYGYSSIRKDSEVFGIIGSPLSHTKSPHIHNPGFRALGIDASYVQFPFPCAIPSDSENGGGVTVTPEAALKDFLDLCPSLDIRGFSVTIPFKESILSLLTGMTTETGVVGACNTVRVRDGGFFGYNTDVAGFLGPILRHFHGNLKARRALVIGAGGAARAVVYGLTGAGADVVVFNRTPAKAQRLSEEFSCSCAGIDSLGKAGIASGADIIVQTTSAGMHPQERINPAAGYRFTGKELAYDLVYSPPNTPFLSAARAAGCGVIGGLNMLLEQAYCQFRIFTGKNYPEEVKAAVRSKLKPYAV